MRNSIGRALRLGFKLRPPHWLPRCAAILALAASQASAEGIIKLQWTLPCFQADSIECSQEGAIAETTLAAAEVSAIRYATRDTVALGDIPEAGRECSGDSADFAFAEHVSLGEIRFRLRDQAGNRACLYTSYVFAIPDSTYGQAPARPPGLSAVYCDRTDFTGTTVSRIEAPIDFSTAADPNWPGSVVGPGSYAVRWTGYVTTNGAGAWTFCTECHDGSRLWLDGALMIDHWVAAGAAKPCAILDLANGEHAIKLEYFESAGQGRIRMLWTPPSGSEILVPASALTH